MFLSSVICHAFRRGRRGTFADHQLRSKRSAEYGVWGATDSGKQDVEAFAGHDVEVGGCRGERWMKEPALGHIIKTDYRDFSGDLDSGLMQRQQGPHLNQIATEMLGSETIVFANLQSGENVTASIRGIRSLPPKATVRFSVDPRFVHVFDDKGIALPPLRSWREDYVEGQETEAGS